LKILKNCAKCNKCGEVLVSKTELGMVRCKCGAVEIGGGKKRLIRYGRGEDYTEKSMVETNKYNRKKV